ncbi:hypothetical protein CBM2605_B170090 [Cupriavidus neocaledonicus]|uniref:Uncharacterized protein n=1 Tax=Cupriavidus neocaledonicus TaxID=1040979 RepID=A0ABY1V9U7_9BURK|nr:hypothetical protein CBM2605_B170090 [Cupriavidus neocaledonicus]
MGRQRTALELHRPHRHQPLGRAGPGLPDLRAGQAPVADRHPHRQGAAGGPEADRLRLRRGTRHRGQQRPYRAGQPAGGGTDRTGRRAIQAVAVPLPHAQRREDQRQDLSAGRAPGAPERRRQAGGGGRAVQVGPRERRAQAGLRQPAGPCRRIARTGHAAGCCGVAAGAAGVLVFHRFADDAAMQRGRALAGAEDAGGSVAGTIGGVPEALSDECAAGATAEWQDGAGEPLRNLVRLTDSQHRLCTPSPACGRGLG